MAVNVARARPGAIFVAGVLVLLAGCGDGDMPTDGEPEVPRDTRLSAVEFCTVGGQTLAMDGPDDPVLREASPVRRVDGDEPAHLVVHGVEDQLVPVNQARSLTDSLVVENLSATLIEVENAGHGLVPSSGPIDPSLAEIEDRVVSFLAEELGGQGFL